MSSFCPTTQSTASASSKLWQLLGSSLTTTLQRRLSSDSVGCPSTWASRTSLHEQRSVPSPCVLPEVGGCVPTADNHGHLVPWRWPLPGLFTVKWFFLLEWIQSWRRSLRRWDYPASAQTSDSPPRMLVFLRGPARSSYDSAVPMGLFKFPHAFSIHYLEFSSTEALPLPPVSLFIRLLLDIR